MFRPTIVALLTLVASPLLAGGPGGVVLDGSFGTSGPLPGPSFVIPASVGKQVGGNLFHSFNQFDLNSTQSATFTGPNNVHNILSRVTSGSASSIDGLVRSDIAGANLFLLNPSGVMFGPHAQIDVTGSFAVSTANYVKLANSGRFNTSLGGQDTLKSAPVTAFGFLTTSPASISVTRNTLNVAPVKSFSVVAGDVAIDGGTITGAGSRVNVVSVKSAGEAQLDATNLDTDVDVTQFAALGEIDLNYVELDTSGIPGGQISIHGNKLFVNGSNLISDTSGSSPGAPIDIVTRDSMSVLFSHISTSTSSSSVRGGDIAIKTGSLTVNDSEISTTTGGPLGKGANVLIEADSLSIRDGVISASSRGIGSNSVVVKLRGALTLNGFSSIFTQAGRKTSSKAGGVLVEAGSLTIDGIGEKKGFLFGLGSAASIFSYSAGTGDSGDVTIKIDGALSLRAGGGISSDTFSEGDGGNVTVSARSILIDGTGSNLNTGISARASNIALSPSHAHTGNGGSVIVGAGNLTIKGGGKISTSAFAQGSGGSVDVTADSLLVDGATSGIFALSLTSAPAGSVRLVLGTLNMDSRSSVSSANSGNGAAGSVIIDTAKSVNLRHGSIISTLSRLGSAGSIKLSSNGVIKLNDQSSVTASAGTKGGNIDITAPDLVYLIDSSITAEAGNAGGNITIDNAHFIVLNNDIISANAAIGQGGNINLLSDFFLNSDSLITATGATNNGTVSIAAPELDLSAALVTLPSSLLSAGTQLRERCAAQLRGDFSSFITLGRGDTEPAPDELRVEF